VVPGLRSAVAFLRRLVPDTGFPIGCLCLVIAGVGGDVLTLRLTVTFDQLIARLSRL
jgi:hypothetical protein